ncbi:MAG: helix-turn-helix transcriptional regulator [Flavobacteriaceae bacterium]
MAKSNKKVLLELANRIKTLREERNLTQAICYDDTGINFSRIERGVRDVSFTTLLRISKYFKIPLKVFIGDTFDDFI